MSDRRRGGAPGRVWSALLRALLPSDHRDAALGDIEEEYASRRSRFGARAAAHWYRKQVLRSVVPGLSHRIRIARNDWASTGSDGEGAYMWVNDLRLAVRVLSKRPGFTATIVVTLALGVGATTALFGVYRGVFLQPFPLPDSDELVIVMQGGSFGCCGPSSGPDYTDWVDRGRSFEGMAALSPGIYTLTGLDEPERVFGTRVTASAFTFLGVEPLLGRPLQPEDQVSDGVVVLGYDLWQRTFAGSRQVVGEGVAIDGQVRTIVGVMPAEFDVPSPWLGTRSHELYIPMTVEMLAGDRGSHGFPVIARLAEGADKAAAQADMDRIMRELAVEYPATNEDRTAFVFTVHEYLYGDVGRQLVLILAAAGLVLMIACGNVAGLQLARGAGREAELAVRSALGASRQTIVRLLFSESLVLATLGGLLGVGIAYLSIDLLKGLLPASIPRVDQVGIDASALAFALGSVVVTAVVFGMLPALLAARTDVASGVREGGRGTLGPGKERARDVFIVAQIAIGLVLTNGAGLLVRSYAELRGQEYGFSKEGVLTLSLNPGGPRYAETDAVQRYYERVIEGVSDVPGVRSVGMVSRLPLSGGSNGNVQVEGRAPRSHDGQGPLVEVVSVVGAYHDAMGIPLLQGRLLVSDDSIAGAVGVLVNQAMVDEVWPDEDPLGRRFSFDEEDWLTVVGVVGNVRQWGPEQPVLSQTYAPFARGWSHSGYLTVSTEGGGLEIASAVRRAVLAVDPAQPPSDVRGMDERLEASFAQRRFYTSIIGLFAIAALFLASAGIYGTVSYFVARRTRELGIRIALGSAATGVVGLVVRRAARLAVLGVGLGLVGVWSTVSIAESLVYGVAAVDPISLLVGCLVFGIVAVAASALPATRAARVPPSLALRSE